MNGPPPSPRVTSLGLVQDRVGPCLKSVPATAALIIVGLSTVRDNGGDRDGRTRQDDDRGVVTKVLMDDPADVIRGSARSGHAVSRFPTASPDIAIARPRNRVLRWTSVSRLGRRHEDVPWAAPLDWASRQQPHANA
jgi:hypothetical protein